jgi:hypothetical protein
VTAFCGGRRALTRKGMERKEWKKKKIINDREEINYDIL